MDPLSVSSGVAGLVSLGLTVCKGINTFCQDYRSRDFDLINLTEHAQRLDSFLQLIQTRLQASHRIDSALSMSLKNCFDASQGCIQEFESLTKKQTRSPGPREVKEYRKDAARHLLYPLQKAKFDRLKTEMQGFYTAMTSYLLLLNQYVVKFPHWNTRISSNVVSSDLANEIREAAISESVKMASLIMYENQKTSSQIAALLPALERVIDTKLAGLERSSLVSLRSSPGADDVSMNSSPSSPPSPKHGGMSLHSKNESWSDTADCLADNFLTSDAMAQASSRIKIEDNAPNTLPSSEVPKDEISQSFGCSCRADSFFGRRDVSIRCRPKHDSHCDLFFTNPSQRAIKGKLQLFSILISWKLEIQYSRRLIYRDLQIHPAIAIAARSLVSNDSPAFALVDELVGGAPDITAEALQAQISSVSKDLRCLFSSGRASPSDVNFGDQTLLHVGELRRAMSSSALSCTNFKK